jgi:DNA end-binding protein Ku
MGRMPQSIWTGAIAFGLVAVPVRLYPATRKQDVRFHELDRVTGQRIHHQRVRGDESASPPRIPELPPLRGSLSTAPLRQFGEPEPSREALFEEPMGREVSYEDVLKGFEVAPNQYVAVSRDELEAVAPERSRTIDIEQFVAASVVDPLYFQTSYYAVPGRDHVRSFALLLSAMRQTNAIGICWIVLRRKRHLAALRPHGNLMLLTTMLHADEILPQDSLEPQVPADLSKKEREMAALLVSTLSGPFEPARYGDEYRQRVRDLIAGKTPVAAPGAPASGGVADLMAALRASVEQAKKTRRTRSQTAARAARSAPRRRRRSA